MQRHVTEVNDNSNQRGIKELGDENKERNRIPQIHIYTHSIDTIYAQQAKLERIMDYFVTIALPHKEPAHLFFATDRNLPLGFSGHLLLKTLLFSSLLQQRKTEKLDRHSKSSISSWRSPPTFPNGRRKYFQIAPCIENLRIIISGWESDSFLSLERKGFEVEELI